MELIRSNWQDLAIFVFAVAFGIYSFRLARRHGYDFVSVLARLIRSLPHHWRMLRDPVYRRKFRCIERFEKQIFDLVTAISARNTLNGISDRELMEAFKVPPENIVLVRQKLERAMADAFDKSKKAASEYLASLTDEDVGVIAAYLSDEWYGGLVGPPPIDAWLRKEREMASTSPVMAATFLARAPKIELS